jgi:hypothetical protein
MVEALAAGPAANERYSGAIAGLVSLVEEDMLVYGDAPPVSRVVLLGLIGGTSMIIYEEILAGRTTELPVLEDDLTRMWVAGFLGYARAGSDPGATRTSGSLRARG